MGPRNLLILFFSTVAFSLVVLIIFFSLFFKNVDLNFNTRLPQSAPDIGGMYSSSSTMNPDSKADGLLRSTVNVPPEMRNAETGKGGDKEKKASAEPKDSDLPPVSDDTILDNNAPPPLPNHPQPSSDTTKTELTKPEKVERTATHTPDRPITPPSARPLERKPERTERFRPATLDETPPPAALPSNNTEPSGPPVPGADNP
jgi:hypothetical protein